MTKLGKETGRPVWFLLTDRPTDTARWRRLIDGVHKARAQGAMVTAQVAGRPVGVLLGIDTALNPFSIRPSYQALLQLPAEERIKRLQDPAMRAQILSEAPSAELIHRLSQFRQRITTSWHRMFPMGDPPNYEPEARDSIAAIAARSNHTPDEVAYDYLAGGAEKFLFFPIVGYNEDNHDIIRTMLTDDATILGLSDGGAHCSSIVDASVPSWMLIHWARDRTARRTVAVGTGGEAADQRDRRLLRLPRPRRAGGGEEGRRQRDRLRGAAAACAGSALRPAEERPPAGAAGGRLSCNVGVGRDDVRERRIHRRDAGQAGAGWGVESLSRVAGEVR